ncbi:MAG: 5'-nucleotidase [Pseudomonadales bacterium]|nr:5'-nucleotidase [Pseudomonadales bacterium]
MGVSFEGKLVIAISSSALFDLAESDAVYTKHGLDAYRDYQVKNEEKILQPGDAFSLVQKLLKINDKIPGEPRVEVILLSRNSSDTGLRIFNSIDHWKLPITRAAFCGGESPYRYVSAFGAHLFLSTNANDVRRAIEMGYAAASILPSKISGKDNDELRFAFDGDAVLFSDESERIFQTEGLTAFTEQEKKSAKTPMSGGPFKGFLQALHLLQKEFPEDACPIRTALVTARSAPAHERVVRTLRHWDIRIDESLFLGGLEKAYFLKAFGADVFFDDQEGHCESARQYVATGHVVHGVTNESSVSD